MNDNELRVKLRELDLQNFFYAIKKLIKEHPTSEEHLHEVLNLDYSKIDKKFNYFKTCYLAVDSSDTDEDVTQPIAARAVEILKTEGYISSFGYKSYLTVFKAKYDQYGQDIFLLAFNYSFMKLSSMLKLAVVDPTKKIKSPIAYFMTAFDSNLKKCINLSYLDKEITEIAAKFAFKVV